ncbi:hypothetical protein GCM10017567_33860 [Amycolatopsis bullii]|uniref:Uncharacterized protein n=1 Tax=Amycolatopsis bullii TaxID=941987 RepID=A0ABQ3KDW7_9PSEU|nr:hypothetical protein GCM10017567_33860 [Amycolatopsis bullii]
MVRRSSAISEVDIMPPVWWGWQGTGEGNLRRHCHASCSVTTSTLTVPEVIGVTQIDLLNRF